MKFYYCKKCLMPSTRPRVTFNKEGVCNACEWAERKKTKIDWKARWKELEELCDKYRDNHGSNWDCIIPCSYGKDSYHIAYNMKHKLKMHPLLVYVSPLLPSDIGRRNKVNLINHGFDAVQIDLDRQIYRKLCAKGFVEEGQPQLAFVDGITTAVVRTAIAYKIPLIMYGEEGESEYGGRMDLAEKAKVDRDWTVQTYFSGHDTSEYIGNDFTKSDLKWWHFPTQQELDEAGLYLTHWSYFENWDHVLHRRTALEIGFERAVKPERIEEGVTNVATFTDYTSLDDPLMRTLHTHLMFLKFGFGRGTQEATNDIRAGLMTREQGIEMVRKYDSYDCSHFRGRVMELFDMTEEEYWKVIDKWANKALLEKVNGVWQLKKHIHHGIYAENALEVG